MILSCRLSGAIALVTLSVLAVPATAAETAASAAQRPANVEVSFAYFEQRLSPFGHWISHPVWGQVWQPDAGSNFRPYFYGYWQYTTDYGWLWVSNEPYGDIVYHYGRWVYDPIYGWLWVPGYVWGPSWVTWRETDGYIGWLPMPPGYQDFSLGTVTPSYAPSELYGYQYFYGSNFALEAFANLWIFTATQDFGRRDRRPYVTDKNRVGDLYRRSRDRTHYEHDRDHDRIVDRSIDKDELERFTHRSFGAQEGGQFLRPGTPVVPVTEGQDIARRDRERNREEGRGRGPSDAGANAPQTLPGPGFVPPSSPPRFGRGRGLGLRDPSQSGGQSGAPADAAANPGGSPPGDAQRQPGRFTPGRAVSGTAPAPIVPPTDVFRGAQNPPLPGAVSPVAPPANAPASGAGTIPQERAFGRARIRGFNLGAAPSAPVPAAPAPALVPNVATVAPPPVVTPGAGMQNPLGGMRRIPAAPAAPILPPVAPPVPAPAPQIAPPAQAAPASPSDRGGRGPMGLRGF